MPAKTMSAHREIVVGVRDLEHSDAGLAFAFEEAALRGARLLAVHAWFWFVPGLQRVGTEAGAVLAHAHGPVAAVPGD